jgi:hypothetical protein
MRSAFRSPLPLPVLSTIRPFCAQPGPHVPALGGHQPPWYTSSDGHPSPDEVGRAGSAQEPRMMLCNRPTGPFLAEPQSYGPTRHRWTGPDGRPQIPCGYDARDVDAMLCHLLATHAMTLDLARRTLAQRIVGGKPSN